MIRIINTILKPFGREICRIEETVQPDPLSSAFESALIASMGTDKLMIVQIGANNGKDGDPLYQFMRRFESRTKILLIEPQENIIPHLILNYSFHKDCTVWPGCIGSKGAIELFAIKKSCWPYVHAEYAKGWPVYRAPSGVTSSNREHVERWAKNHIRHQDAVESIIVESTPLLPLMERLGLIPSYDVLQVDTEGTDDIVIENCSIDIVKPKIIHFEQHSINNRIKEYLRGLGYITTSQGDNCLAILPSPQA